MSEGKFRSHQRSTRVGSVKVGNNRFNSMLFLDDDRVEIFTGDNQDSIGLIFTANCGVRFKGKEIGKVRSSYDVEHPTIVMELFGANDEIQVIDSGVSEKRVECFLEAELVFTKWLIGNKVIDISDVVKVEEKVATEIMVVPDGPITELQKAQGYSWSVRVTKK